MRRLGFKSRPGNVGNFIKSNIPPSITVDYLVVDYLVVAGGGGGGITGGGGGAGGYRTNVSGQTSGRNSSAESTLELQPDTPYTVTIGAGGSNSTFHTITSLAGGNGHPQQGPGSNGGSGGGGSWGNFGDSIGYNSGSGTTGQGFDGGRGGSAYTYYHGGGGGGAGAAGTNGYSVAGGAGSGGNGGNGLSNNITGTSVTRGGGGAGGAAYTSAGSAGSGGGGTGNGGGIGPGSNGIANTGGGGGGGWNTASSGGSGIVIIKYPSTNTVTVGAGLTSSESTSGGFKIRTFTAGTGNITFENSIVTNGLVLNLDAGNASSYPGSGTTWTDLSGNGNNSTLTNGPTFNSSNGGSIVFDGSNDYSIGGNTLNINGSLTLECFIYPTSYPSGAGGGGFLISNLGYYFELKNNGVLRSYFYGASTPGYHNGTATVPLNTWSQVLVVRNTSDNTIKHYVNGVLDNTISNITGNTSNGSQNVQIGGYQSGTYLYVGRMAIVRAYNRALLDSEIILNFNANRSRFGI